MNQVKTVKAKTLYDNVVRHFQCDIDMPLKKGMLFVGQTCFGEDIVEIECPKSTEFTEEKWHEYNFGCAKGEEKKKSYFAFEPKLLRLAKDSENQQHLQNLKDAEEHRAVFEEKIEQYNINMKIIRLYYTLSRDRLVCVYTATQRVDFRELVKDLGSLLKQRIELYQVSMHDVFALSSDCGVCGRQLCCTLGCTLDFQRNRKASSSKMLGVCGKTKCCISYELEEDKIPFVKKETESI